MMMVLTASSFAPNKSYGWRDRLYTMNLSIRMKPKFLLVFALIGLGIFYYIGSYFCASLHFFNCANLIENYTIHRTVSWFLATPFFRKLWLVVWRWVCGNENAPKCYQISYDSALTCLINMRCLCKMLYKKCE